MWRHQAPQKQHEKHKTKQADCPLIIIDYWIVQPFLTIFQLYAQNLHFIYLFLFSMTVLITWKLGKMKRSGWTMGSSLVPSAMQRKNEERVGDSNSKINLFETHFLKKKKKILVTKVPGTVAGQRADDTT